MPSQTVAEAVVDAPAGAILDVVGDIDAYPRWARGVQAATVLAQDDLGWPLRARFTLAGSALRDTHVLAYRWDVAEDGTGTVSWTLESSEALTALDGSYTLTPAGSGTRVEYRLSVDLRVPVPAVLRRRAERSIVAAALESLRDRVEAVGPESSPAPRDPDDPGDPGDPGIA